MKDLSSKEKYEILKNTLNKYELNEPAGVISLDIKGSNMKKLIKCLKSHYLGIANHIPVNKNRLIEIHIPNENITTLVVTKNYQIEIYSEKSFLILDKELVTLQYLLNSEDFVITSIYCDKYVQFPSIDIPTSVY